MKIYIVVRNYMGGKIELLGAYYTEEIAKQKAGQFINLDDKKALFLFGLQS